MKKNEKSVKKIPFLLVAVLLSQAAAGAEKRAWVKFDTSTKAITFYYTEKSSLGEGEYDLNKGNDTPGWIKDNIPNEGDYTAITKAVFDESFAEARPTSCSHWFDFCGNMTEIVGIRYLDTSEVTDMSYMFANCSLLTTLDLSNFDTRKVTDMSYMFVGNSLTSLDLSAFDTGNVTNMYRMFRFCRSFTTLELSHFDTKNVKDFEEMFFNCTSLTTVYASDAFACSSTAHDYQMFYNCKNLKGDIAFDASKTGKSCAKVDGGYFTDYLPHAKPWVKYNEGTLSFRFSVKETTYSNADEFELNSGQEKPSWESNSKNITKVEFRPSFLHARPTTCYRWFYQCKNLEKIEGMEYLNTSEVTDMSSMFYYCNKLSSLDLTHFNLEKVTDMSNMFNGCIGLTSLDLTHFNTQEVTDMSSMFCGCTGLTSLDLTHFNTEKVTDMSSMFNSCIGLTSLDLTHFDTQEVTDMSYMFCNCPKLTSLDLTHFNTEKVTNMSSMFNFCNVLPSLDLTHFNTEKVTNMSCMFTLCQGLTSLDLSSFNTGKVTNMVIMFKSCSNLQTIYTDQAQFVVQEGASGSEMFRDCQKLIGDIAYDASKIDESYATVDGGYFTDKVYTRPWVKYAEGTLTFQYGYKKTIDKAKGEYLLNSSTEHPNWISDHGTDIIRAVFAPSFAYVRPTSCHDWFYDCENLTTIEGIRNLNTSLVTDMRCMFLQCKNLTELDVSGFNTENVTNMNSMFNFCSCLTELDVSGFNTEKVTDLSGMFECCLNLTSLDVSGFNTQKATDISYMFGSCFELESLDVTHFKTDSVAYISRMFSYCRKLTSLDLRNFNTKKVKDIYGMFMGSDQLKEVYIGEKFKTQAVTYGDGMWENCPAVVYCLPGQYADVKTNSLFDGRTVKPYVPINATAEYGTLCVPVGSTLAEGSYTGFDKLYTAETADMDGNTVTLKEAKSIEPGTAYVYHRNLPTDATVIAITYDADMDASTAVTTPKNDTGQLLKGTFESIIAPAGKHILQTDGMFHPVADDNTTLTVGAYRAWLDLSPTTGGEEHSSQSLRMVFGGDATAIDRISNTDGIGHGSQPKVYFDLTGRRVSHPQRGGIYITEGRKVVID